MFCKGCASRQDSRLPVQIPKALSANISQILSADQVFNPAVIAKLAGDRSDLHTNAEAVVYAATSTPALVFTGETGIAKLDAWARAGGYTK